MTGLKVTSGHIRSMRRGQTCLGMLLRVACCCCHLPSQSCWSLRLLIICLILLHHQLSSLSSTGGVDTLVDKNILKTAAFFLGGACVAHFMGCINYWAAALIDGEDTEFPGWTIDLRDEHPEGTWVSPLSRLHCPTRTENRQHVFENSSIMVVLCRTSATSTSPLCIGVSPPSPLWDMVT